MLVINRNELKAKIDRGEHFILLETLPESDFVEIHLPGAIHLPADQLHDLATQVLPDKDAEIVVYGDNPPPNCSARAVRELTALGYTNVKTYPGGKQDWIDAGLPTESEWDEPTPPP